MERAREAFKSKGLKLTPLRQSVFQEIAGSHRAIGAYEVLDKLAAKGERLAPISVYRAIDALVTAGLVHRFESRNAFFACHAGHEMRQLILACETCGRVAEVDGDKVFAAIDTVGGLGVVLGQGRGGRGVGPVRQLRGRAAGARAWKAVTRREIGRSRDADRPLAPAAHRAHGDLDHHHHHHAEAGSRSRCLTMPTR